MGHVVIDEAIRQAKQFSASITAISNTVLPDPIIAYRIVDRVTSMSSNVRAATVGVEFRGDTPLVHRDWELLLRLNELLERRTLRRATATRHLDNVAEMEALTRSGQRIIEAEVHRLDLPFSVPEVQLLAVFWPIDRDGSGKSDTPLRESD